MRAYPALFALWTFALAGCETTSVAPPAAPIVLGTETTPWGVLPRYAQGHLKPNSNFRPGGAPPPGKVVADVLVEREGKVREVAIVEADGAPGAAKAAYAMLMSGSYLPLPADGPELYVVRQTIEIKPSTRSSIPAGGTNNDGGGNVSMPANQAWPNPTGAPR